ncbi:hypothetical protein SPF06_11605 [Sinomonas sp. JGH33]|uniref:Uncharacterized protein n=1 Tax=Sinomonas terricola TaxID=3110330 RepID=A0ABU5T768_9MICC|nr:hypothetical protein [Sinomonas sp. JGH33]MEA5455367.1 hypothetical protein [Sinomonas sp. JGH33]
MAEHNSASMNVSWRTIAGAASVLALTGLVGLAVVATLRDADTLSVVALALAIIAFVVQIIVFIVQGDAAAKQAANSAEIYSRTLRALTAIEEKAEGTREAVGLISEKLIDMVISKAIPEAQMATAAEPDSSFSEELTARAKEIFRSSVRATAAAERVPHPRSLHEPELDSFLDAAIPSDRLEEAIEIADKLEDIELSSMRHLANDQAEAERAESGGRIGLFSVNNASELGKLQLIRRVQVGWADEPVLRLTSLGMDVARVIVGKARYSDDRVNNIRRRIFEWDQRVAESAARRQRDLESLPLETEARV